MASQTVLMELGQGDRVQVGSGHVSRVTCVTCHVSRAMLQVYLYTFTGLHDKPGNHLTQFMGVLLKPLACLPDSSVLTEKPKKRVIMSLE